MGVTDQQATWSVAQVAPVSTVFNIIINHLTWIIIIIGGSNIDHGKAVTLDGSPATIVLGAINKLLVLWNFTNLFTGPEAERLVGPVHLGRGLADPATDDEHLKSKLFLLEAHLKIEIMLTRLVTW